ncbi:MAG: phospho-N-acetylmuramoyl-pentapeptide-transferase [Clostridia bacterium]
MREDIFALLLAVGILMITGPWLIPLLKRFKFGQTEREEGPKSHLIKQGTPTMGGIMIILAVIAGTIAFSNGNLELALPAILIMTGYGLVGFLDDFIKIKLKRNLGLKAYQKIIGQFGIALIVALYCYNSPYIGSILYFPFINAELDLGIFYIPFAMILVIGMVNSVNLTDGLDGLASGISLIYCAAMAIVFMYMSTILRDEGQIMSGANFSAMSVFAASTVGACLGFLRFNSYPARIFMGDTGSMALGGAISAMALFSRSPFSVFLMGGCFVASAVSVILQVGSYKLRNKKRIFKMAPLHHHFELCGYSETKIVAGYMIVTTVLCLICLLAYI